MDSFGQDEVFKDTASSIKRNDERNEIQRNTQNINNCSDLGKKCLRESQICRLRNLLSVDLGLVAAFSVQIF